MAKKGLDLTRQSGLIPTEVIEAVTVHITGAGAVGSHTAEVLCKMGIRDMEVVDFDHIEAHNLPNQGFYIPDLGKPKVEALALRLNDGLGANVVAVNTKIEEPPTFAQQIVISAVDSMAVREILWAGFLKSPEARYFVDGRMGARFGKVYFVDKADPKMLKKYAGSLHSDEEGYQAPCTEKATIFCAYGLSALIGALVAKSVTGDTVNFETDLDLAGFTLMRCM